jgi:hypothetical protein
LLLAGAGASSFFRSSARLVTPRHIFEETETKCCILHPIANERILEFEQGRRFGMLRVKQFVEKA